MAEGMGSRDQGGFGSHCSFFPLPVRGQSGEGWEGAGAAELQVRDQ